MSNSIDQRIVQMKFDNTLFEKNVATSIGTLEKLKSALDFSGATNSLNNIERNVNAADFSKLSNSIQSISDRFSAFGIVGMTVIQDLVHAAENLGVKMYNATIGQIQTGGWTRATNIDKAKFAIEGLNQSWEELSKSIDKAVTDTRFGFDEAATAASQLVASNVAVGEEMDNALKSIANVASQTGDEYSSIAHIYTTIAGNGRMMTEQLNMFSYRGLNVASMMANVWGKTEAEVREMATKGEISFKMFSDAMNEALGEGAKRANETFEGSMANMKAALSRIGQPFAASYRKYMPSVFNNLKDRIKEIKTALEPIETRFDDFMKRATDFIVHVIQNIDLSWVTNLVNWISKLYDSILGIDGVATPLLTTVKKQAGDAFNFFLGIYEKVRPAASKVKETTEKLTAAAETVKNEMGPVFNVIGEFAKPLDSAAKLMTGALDKTLDETKAVATTAEHVDEIARRVIAGEFGNGQVRFDALEAAGENWKIIQNRVNEMLDCNYRYEVSQEELNAAFGETNELLVYNNQVTAKQKSLFEKLGDWLLRLADMIHAAFAQIDMEYVIGRVTYIVAGLVSAFELVGKTVGTVIDAGLGPFVNILISIGYLLLDTASSIGEWLLNLRNAAEASGFFDKLHDILIVIFETISIIATDATNLLAVAISGIGVSFGKIGETILGTWTKIKETFASFKETDTFKTLSESFEKLRTRFVEFKTQVFDAFQRQLDKFRNSEIKLPKIDTDKLGKFFTDVSERITKVFDWLTDKLDVNKFTQVFGTLVDTFGQVASVVRGTLSTAFTLAGSAFGFVIDKVKYAIEAIKTFFGSFKESKGFAAFKDNLVEIGNRLKDLRARAGKALDGIFKKLKNTKKNLPTDKIKEFGNTVGEALRKISEWVNNLLSKIDIEAVIEGVANALTTIGGALLKVAKVVGGVFVTAFKMAGPILTRVFELFKSGIEIVKGFWDSFKNSTAFEGIKGIASTVGDWIGGIVDNVKNGDFKLPEIDSESLKQSFENVRTWLGERWDGITGWFAEKWEALKAWFKEKWDSLFKKNEGEEAIENAGFEFPEINVDKIKQSFDDFIEWIQQKIDTVRKLIIGFLGGEVAPDSISEGALGLPSADDLMLVESLDSYTKPHPVIEFLKSLASALFGLAGDTVLTALDVLDRLVKLIEDHFPTIGTILSDVVGGVLGEVKKFVDDVNSTDELSDKIDKVKDIIMKIFTTILKLKAIKAAIGIADFFANLGGLVKTAKDAVKNFSRVLKSISKAFTGAGRALTALAILELAGAVLLMAGAFKILGSLTWDQFKVAASAIAVITGALALLFLTLGGGKKDVVETPITQLADAFKVLGSKLAQGLKRLGTAAEIAAFVWGIKTLMDTIKGLTDFNWGDAHQGVELFSLVVGETVGAIKLINLGNGKKSFGNQIGVAAELIALAIAIKSIADTLIKLSDIDQDKLGAAVDAIDSVMWIAMKLSLLGGFDSSSASESSGEKSLWKKNKLNDIRKNSSSSSASTKNTKWKTILATAGLVWVVGNALYKLAKLKDTGRLMAATDAISDVMTMCVAVLAAAGFISDEKSTSEAASEWDKQGGLFGKIFGVRTGKSSHNNSYSNMNKSVKNILAICGLLIVVAGAISLVAGADKAYKIEAAADAIAKIVEMCALLLMASAFIADEDTSLLKEGRGGLIGKIFGNRNVNKKSNSTNNAGLKILAICALIGTIAYSLYSLSSMDANKIEAAGDAIAKIALVCIGILAASSFISSGQTVNQKEGGLLGKIFGGSSYNKTSTTSGADVFLAVLPIITAIASAALAIYELRDVEPDTIEASGNAIAKVVLACAGIVAACGFLTSSSGDGSWVNQAISAITAVVSIFESVELGKNAIIAIATLDVDAEKLKASGEALFDALAGIAVVLLAAGALTALGSGGVAGAIVAGVMAAISIILSLIDMIPGAHEFMYGAEGAEDSIGFIERMITAFNSIGRMINGFVSGLLGTDNIGDDIREGVGSMAEGFSTSISGLGDSITGAFESLKSINIPELMDSMGINEIPGKLSQFVDDFKAFTEKAKEIKSEDMNALKTALTALIEIIGVDAISAIVQTLKPDDESGVIKMVTDLNENFFPKFDEFVENAKGLDADDLAALKSLVNVLEEIAKTAIIGDLAWLVGEHGLTKMAESLPALVSAMDEYNEAIKDKDWNYAKFVLTANCAQAIIKVANAAPKTGGFLQTILGESDMEEFGKSCLAFIGYMIDANNKLDGVTFDQDAFEAAVEAGSAMNDLAWKIPRTGGIAQAILGEEDLALFGERVKIFIGYLIEAANELGDGSSINKDAMEKAKDCGEFMAALESAVPAQDGVLQDFVGEKNLGAFGRRLKAYVKHLAATSKILTENPIDETAITSAGKVGELLANLETSVAPTKGALSEFFGDTQSLADFGDRLKQFGESMVYFSDMVKGEGEWSNGNPFDNLAVSTAVETLQQLWDFVERVEGSGIGSIVNATDTNIEKAGVIQALQSFSTAVFDVLQFYNDLGAQILSEEAFDASGILENCKAAGERLAEEIVKGLTTKLEEIDEGKQTPIMRILIKALTDAIGNDRFLSSVRAKGQTIGVTLVEGLMKIFTEDEEGNENSFPAFVRAFVAEFQNMIDTILLAMSDAEPLFRASGEAWMKNLRDGVNFIKPYLISNLKNIPLEILANYGSKYNDFYDAGASWMNALYEGAAERAQKVYDLANNVANYVETTIAEATAKAQEAVTASGSRGGTSGGGTLQRSIPVMANQMERFENTGLRTANALTEAVKIGASNGEMAFQQLQSLSGIQNGAFLLSRDAGTIADSAAASMSRTVSLAKSASMTNPITNQVYVKDSNDTIEALNGMRRDIKVLTENMANMQMVLDSGVLVGQLTPGLDVSLSQRTKFKGRWA